MTQPDHRSRSTARSLRNPAVAVPEITEGGRIKTDTAGENRGNWANDPRLRQTGVVVCTTSCTLVGTAHLMSNHRLLDELNGGFVANLYRLGDEFLPLTEVRMIYPGGAQDIALSTHVRKSNILFIAERGAGLNDRTGPKDGKAASYRIKKPLSAKVFVPPYVLEGKMHVALWQELAQALDGDNRFLPMTDVTISPALPSGEAMAAFAAVNKEQIVHIGELSEALERMRQDVQKALDTGKAADQPAADRTAVRAS